MSDISPAIWRIGGVVLDSGKATVLEVGGKLVTLSELIGGEDRGIDPDSTVFDLLQDWDAVRPLLAELALGVPAAAGIQAGSYEWLPTVEFPRKLIVCGANYREHVAEMGTDPDSIATPFTLLKPASTSPIGADRPIVLPAKADWVDWEGELGVVIGRRVRHSGAGEALATVAGYLPTNDLSARDWMKKQVPGVGMDWTLHKGFDGFTPMGPLMTPAEFVPDPQDLDLRVEVSGTVRQHSSTSDMIFSVAELIEHLTSIMTLEPGDVLLTGTPSGSGIAMDPPQCLHPGDTVDVYVSGLGTLSNPVVAP